MAAVGCHATRYSRLSTRHSIHPLTIYSPIFTPLYTLHHQHVDVSFPSILPPPRMRAHSKAWREGKCAAGGRAEARGRTFVEGEAGPPARLRLRLRLARVGILARVVGRGGLAGARAGAGPAAGSSRATSPKAAAEGVAAAQGAAAPRATPPRVAAVTPPSTSPASSGDAGAPRVADGDGAAEAAPEGAAVRAVLERDAAEGVVRGGGGGAGGLTAAAAAPAPPPPRGKANSA